MKPTGPNPSARAGPGSAKARGSTRPPPPSARENAPGSASRALFYAIVGFLYFWKKSLSASLRSS